MLEQIRNLLRSTPFAAFTILTADGREYHVPTADHAWIAPTGRICVGEDDGAINYLSPLLVANVRSENQPSSAA